MAPSWLLDLLITVSLASSMPLTMRRFCINQDLHILTHLASCDVQGLKILFSQGLAYPLDIVLDDVSSFNDDGEPKRVDGQLVPRTVIEVNVRARVFTPALTMARASIFGACRIQVSTEDITHMDLGPKPTIC